MAGAVRVKVPLARTFYSIGASRNADKISATCILSCGRTVFSVRLGCGLAGAQVAWGCDGERQFKMGARRCLV